MVERTGCVLNWSCGNVERLFSSDYIANRAYDTRVLPVFGDYNVVHWHGDWKLFSHSFAHD